MTIVEEAEEDGGIDEHEGELIRSAIEFNDVSVQDILTHRVDLIAIDDEMSNEAVSYTHLSLEKGEGSLTSYAAPEQGAVHSVQFVYRIDAIESPTETTSTAQEEEKGFWERVLDLFR